MPKPATTSSSGGEIRSLAATAVTLATRATTTNAVCTASVSQLGPLQTSVVRAGHRRTGQTLGASSASRAKLTSQWVDMKSPVVTSSSANAI